MSLSPAPRQLATCRYCEAQGTYGKPIVHAQDCPIVTGARPRRTVTRPEIPAALPDECKDLHAVSERSLTPTIREGSK